MTILPWPPVGGTSIANGGGLVVVNADGSVSVTPATGTGVLLGVAPPATATRALFQIGNGPIDGVTAGHYTGSASGGGYGANFASGYAGDLMHLQIAGVSKLVMTSGYLGVAGRIYASSYVAAGFANNVPVIPMLLQAAGQVGDAWQVQFGATVFAGCRSDGLIYTGATGGGLATKVKAGVPADADWAVAPPDGTMVIDSTDSKAYWRVGGAWKSVVIA